MARTKEIWDAKYVPGSARAEGRNIVSFNVITRKDPDRVIRVTQTTRELEIMMREMSREKERSAAREIFNLGE